MADSTSVSVSTPISINSPQSNWGLQLSQLLSIVAKGQYDWARGVYEDGKTITDGMIAKFMELSGQGAGLANKLIQEYHDEYAPLAKQYIAQANSYNSEARQHLM